MNLTTNRILITLFILFGIASTILFLLHPCMDGDFFWHLKTGEWMWQNKSLMTTDPFTITPLPEQTPRSGFIMSSYWFAQLIIYAFYSIGGFPGIIIYRCLIAGIMFYGIKKWGGFNNLYSTSIAIVFWTFTLDSYYIERPNFLSFVFLGGILIVIFKHIESAELKSLLRLLFPLSLMMLLWGNMHGGFILGQVILILITITEGVKFFLPSKLNPITPVAYRQLLISSLVAIGAAICNPNPITSIKMFFSVNETNTFQYTTNTEYASLFRFITLNNDKIALLYITAIILTFIILLSSKQRTNITWIAIISLTAYMGCKHIRYIPFFFIAATLCTTKIFITEQYRIPIKLTTVCFALFTLFYSLKDEPNKLKLLSKYGFIDKKEYPAYAADFIEKNRLEGNIFNHFDWGGFLLWRFGEKNKVFCDGRQLYPSRYWEWLTALSITSNEQTSWKTLLDKYNIQTVILPFIGKDGEIFGLTSVIRADKEWKLVFAKNNAAVFRRTDTNH